MMARKRPPCVKGAPPKVVGDCYNPSVAFGDTSPYTGEALEILLQVR